MILRRLAPLWAALLLLVPALSQAFPDRTVQLIVPQSTGGASDTLARIVAAKLLARWGKPVVVENRAGAGGNIGMAAVAQAAPDGHTLLMSYVGTHAINGALYSNLPFDPQKSFAAVATLATVPFVAIVSPGLPVKSIADLVALAKSKPTNFGSAGNGSVNHLLGEMFNERAGVRLTHVPYRGAAQAMTDLIGGQIQVVFTSVPSTAAQIRAGQVRPLAVTSAKRAGAFPDVPTIAESGYAGFDVSPWFGLFTTGGTPGDVVVRLNADINAVLRDPEVLERFAAQGAEVLVSSPAEFADRLSQDIGTWSAIVKASGAKVD